MKNILISIIVLILLSWGAWTLFNRNVAAPQGNTATSTATSTPSDTGLSTYSDSGDRFSLKYPSEWQVASAADASSTPTGWTVFNTNPGHVVAKITVPKDLYPNTNFSEAWLTVGWSNDPNAIKTCTRDLSRPNATATDAVIGGRAFKEMSGTDVGLGNYYDSTGYHALLDGDCWSIEYTVHSTNIQNYPPEAGIKEFDAASLKAKLEAAAKSFAWKVNSN